MTNTNSNKWNASYDKQYLLFCLSGAAFSLVTGNKLALMLGSLGVWSTGMNTGMHFGFYECILSTLIRISL